MTSNGTFNQVNNLRALNVRLRPSTKLAVYPQLKQ